MGVVIFMFRIIFSVLVQTPRLYCLWIISGIGQSICIRSQSSRHLHPWRCIRHYSWPAVCPWNGWSWVGWGSREKCYTVQGKNFVQKSEAPQEQDFIFNASHMNWNWNPRQTDYTANWCWCSSPRMTLLDCVSAPCRRLPDDLLYTVSSLQMHLVCFFLVCIFIYFFYMY